MDRSDFEQEVLVAIQAKRELAGLGAGIVRERVAKRLRQDKRLREKILGANSFNELSRSELFKAFVKDVRAELRTIYGVFDLDEKRRRQDLARALTAEPDNYSLHMEILSLHQSSRERLPYYPEIYRRIFAITGKPASILDLACGANPYSYGMLGCKPRYFAIDLPNEELKGIAAYFTSLGIKGGVLGGDIVKSQLPGMLPHVDICFLLKALDTFETQQRNCSGRILDSVKATWLAVSFPTMSLGGKKHIRSERRAWFERLLTKRGWHVETFETGAERFYIILKEPDLLAQKRYEHEWKKLLLKFDAFTLADELHLFRKLLPNGKVLDLGCAGGRDVESLTSSGYEATGIDANAEFIAAARKRVPTARFVIGDIRHLPFADGSFDGIWCLSVLVHSYDATAMMTMNECFRVLRPGGLLLLSVKEGRSLLRLDEGKPVFYRRYTEEELSALLKKAGFVDIHIEHVPLSALRPRQRDVFLRSFSRKPR